MPIHSNYNNNNIKKTQQTNKKWHINARKMKPMKWLPRKKNNNNKNNDQAIAILLLNRQHLPNGSYNLFMILS